MQRSSQEGPSIANDVYSNDMDLIGYLDESSVLTEKRKNSRQRADGKGGNEKKENRQRDNKDAPELRRFIKAKAQKKNESVKDYAPRSSHAIARESADTEVASNLFDFTESYNYAQDASDELRRETPDDAVDIIPGPTPDASFECDNEAITGAMTEAGSPTSLSTNTLNFSSSQEASSFDSLYGPSLFESPEPPPVVKRSSLHKKNQDTVTPRMNNYSNSHTRESSNPSPPAGFVPTSNDDDNDNTSKSVHFAGIDDVKFFSAAGDSQPSCSRDDGKMNEETNDFTTENTKKKKYETEVVSKEALKEHKRDGSNDSVIPDGKLLVEYFAKLVSGTFIVNDQNSPDANTSDEKNQPDNMAMILDVGQPSIYPDDGSSILQHTSKETSHQQNDDEENYDKNTVEEKDEISLLFSQLDKSAHTTEKECPREKKGCESALHFSEVDKSNTPIKCNSREKKVDDLFSSNCSEEESDGVVLSRIKKRLHRLFSKNLTKQEERLVYTEIIELLREQHSESFDDVPHDIGSHGNFTLSEHSNVSDLTDLSMTTYNTFDSMKQRVTKALAGASEQSDTENQDPPLFPSSVVNEAEFKFLDTLATALTKHVGHKDANAETLPNVSHDSIPVSDTLQSTKTNDVLSREKQAEVSLTNQIELSKEKEEEPSFISQNNPCNSSPLKKECTDSDGSDAEENYYLQCYLDVSSSADQPGQAANNAVMSSKSSSRESDIKRYLSMLGIRAVKTSTPTSQNQLETDVSDQINADAEGTIGMTGALSENRAKVISCKDSLHSCTGAKINVGAKATYPEEMTKAKVQESARLCETSLQSNEPAIGRTNIHQYNERNLRGSTMKPSLDEQSIKYEQFVPIICTDGAFIADKTMDGDVLKGIEKASFGNDSKEVRTSLFRPISNDVCETVPATSPTLMVESCDRNRWDDYFGLGKENIRLESNHSKALKKQPRNDSLQDNNIRRGLPPLKRSTRANCSSSTRNSSKQAHYRGKNSNAGLPTRRDTAMDRFILPSASSNWSVINAAETKSISQSKDEGLYYSDFASDDTARPQSDECATLVAPNVKKTGVGNKKFSRYSIFSNKKVTTPASSKGKAGVGKEMMPTQQERASHDDDDDSSVVTSPLLRSDQNTTFSSWSATGPAIEKQKTSARMCPYSPEDRSYSWDESAFGNVIRSDEFLANPHSDAYWTDDDENISPRKSRTGYTARQIRSSFSAVTNQERYGKSPRRKKSLATIITDQSKGNNDNGSVASSSTLSRVSASKMISKVTSFRKNMKEHKKERSRVERGDRSVDSCPLLETEANFLTLAEASVTPDKAKSVADPQMYPQLYKDDCPKESSPEGKRSSPSSVKDPIFFNSTDYFACDDEACRNLDDGANIISPNSRKFAVFQRKKTELLRDDGVRVYNCIDL